MPLGGRLLPAPARDSLRPCPHAAPLQHRPSALVTAMPAQPPRSLFCAATFPLCARRPCALSSRVTRIAGRAALQTHMLNRVVHHSARRFYFMAPKTKRQINGKANVAKAKHVIAKQVSRLARAHEFEGNQQERGTSPPLTGSKQRASGPARTNAPQAIPKASLLLSSQEQIDEMVMDLDIWHTFLFEYVL